MPHNHPPTQVPSHSLVPTPRLAHPAGYSLEALGTFDFQSNIQDFLAMDMQRPTTAAELHTSIKELEGVFCKPET